MKQHHLANVGAFAAHIGSGDDMEIRFHAHFLRSTGAEQNCTVAREEAMEEGGKKWKMKKSENCVDYFSDGLDMRVGMRSKQLTVSLETNALGEKWLRIGWRPAWITSSLPKVGRQKPPAELTCEKETITSSWQTISRSL